MELGSFQVAEIMPLAPKLGSFGNARGHGRREPGSFCNVRNHGPGLGFVWSPSRSTKAGPRPVRLTRRPLAS